MYFKFNKVNSWTLKNRFLADNVQECKFAQIEVLQFTLLATRVVESESPNSVTFSGFGVGSEFLDSE